MPSQISGSSAVAIQVYQALYGRAPSNALLNSYIAQANANPQQTSAQAASALANDLASGFSTTTNAALALQVLNNVNITATTVNAASYATLLSALEAAFLGFGPASRGQIILNLTNLLAKLEGDATYGVAATGFNNQAYANFVYGSNGANTSPSVVAVTLSTFNLTVGTDNVQGTAGDDLIISRVFGNVNSLNSADVIAAGAGKDTLYADVVNPGIAITAETTGVEIVQIRAQSRNGDSSQNNIQISQIDAQRMVGVNHWESNNSRSDVVIEDVRILANQITKDITIAFVESDPGHVDYGVYFDQLSLRSQSNTTSVLSIEILDTRSQALGTGPLKDNPYDSFAFLIGTTNIIVRSPAIDSALTYADLRAAIDAQITVLKATQPLLANFSVTLGAEFTRFDTQSGQAVKGTTIVLTDTGGGVLSTNPLAGFATSSGFVPPVSGLHTSISTVATSSTEKVTSKIILDDVGRGSTGGDLVVGGLSTGATSSSKGVERFEIRVDDNSKLESINSTNNTLQEVTFVNGLTTSSSFAYGVTVKDKGNLTVNGNSGLNGGNVTAGLVGAIQGNGNSGAGQQTGIDAQNGDNAPLPGSAAQTARNFGFSDVRLLDGSAMAGQLAFSAEITGASIPKYMNLRDIGALPASDNIAFSYSGGANDDALFVQIDGGVAGSRSTIVSGREDFTFTANGGAGNDAITLRVVDGLSGGAQFWYTNQKLNANIFINGGDGNDTIRTPGAGDVVIDAGTGDDTVYTDNTGALAATASSGASSTTAAVAKTNDSAAELAAAIAAAAAENTTGFVTLAATVDGGFNPVVTTTAAAAAALDTLSLVVTGLTAATAVAPVTLPTRAQIETAINNATAAGGLTFAQELALNAAFNVTTGGTLDVTITMVPQAIATEVAVAGAFTAGELAAGNALLATFITAAKAAQATAASNLVNKANTAAVLNGTQLAVVNATDAINRVFDATTATAAGTQTTVTNLATLQAGIAVGTGAEAAVTALQTAVINGAITGAESNTLFTALGAFPVAAAGSAAANLTLAVLINNAANANTAAQTTLANANAALTALTNAEATTAAGNPAGESGAAAAEAAGTLAALNTFNNTVLTPANTKSAELAALKAAIVGAALVTGATSELSVSLLTANAVAALTITAGDKAAIDGAAGAGAPAVGGFVDLVEKINVDRLITALQVTQDAVVAQAALTSANLAAINTAAQTAATIAAAANASGGNSLNIASPRAVFVFDTTNQTSTYNRLTQDDRNLADLKSDVNNTNNFFNATVKVTFKGLDASVVLAGTNFKTSDLQINQAIKQAINSDPVLSKLLVATDGPANTLVVTSLIDGTQTTANLAVTVTMPTSVTSVDLAGAIAAGLVPAGSTDAALITALGVAKAAFDLKGDYVTQFAEAGALGGNTVLVGAPSTSSSDNTVTPGVGNDVIVLGTTVGTDALTSSNEVVVYSGSFGNDTIVNFAATGLGVDKLNFSALNGTAANFGSLSADKSIVVGAATATALTATQIAALFTDSATAINHVYVAVDANNIGSIWQVADAAGVAAGSVTATLVGSIDLADTSWAAITAANFV